ncbi:U4/U6.U5 tri-snRNP-associated protein 1 [Aphelenchoides bicaudatus]|nr:U4/U6.U5 tri-snRNP-associated protein 1 [Aphelenchoides bicaudatus]
MSSKYTRKRKHDLDQDTSAESRSDAPREKSEKSSPSKRSKSEKSNGSAGGGKDESISIEETNRIRAELGLAPLEMDNGSKNEEADEPFIDTEGGTLFKEDGVRIVHKAAKNLTQDKETSKLREKLELQKEKHRIYGKVLKATKGLGESSDEEDGGGVNDFLERMRQLAEKKASDFDSMDQEAEQEAVAQQKKAKQRQARQARKKEDISAGGLLIGHGKDAFTAGTETILVLQDKHVLDDDTEEMLVNPNMVENEHHKRNVEKRKQKSDYSAYEEETIDEFGNAKKKAILDKYDQDLDGDGPRETFRLNTTGGYELEREEQELEMKRRLMMANKRFETLEVPKYTQAREFYTEEEMLTFRKPKKKKDKLRKSRTLKAADLSAEQETEEEKAAKAERLAARRKITDDKMEIDEESKNGSASEPKTKSKKSEKKEIEEGEVEDNNEEATAPSRSKWKQGTGAAIDLSRIRSFAARVDAGDSDESDENEDLVQGVNLTGVVIDDEIEDELQSVLARTRNLNRVKEDREQNDEEARRVRLMLSAHGAIKQEFDEESDEEQKGATPYFEDGIVIDATSEQYKMIGDIPTFGLAGNRDDHIDYSEIIAEHQRLNEKQAKERQNQQPQTHSDDEDESDMESDIKTAQLKRGQDSDSDMEIEQEDVKKPTWKTIGQEEPTSSKRASDTKSVRSYRKRKTEEDSEMDGVDYTNVLGEERDATKGVAAMLRVASEKGYLDIRNRNQSANALKHLESKRFSRIDQGRMDIEDKYIRKLERMGTTGSGPIRPFAEKSDYKPSVEITYTDKGGHLLEQKEAFRELSHKFHGKGSGKKKIEKRFSQHNKKERMKQMNSTDTPLGTMEKQRKKQEQLQTPFLVLTGSNRSDQTQLQKD